MYLGAIPGDPDEVIVSTTDPDLVTVWMGASDLTREAAEDLAALLMRAVANSAADGAARRARPPGPSATTTTPPVGHGRSAWC